MKMTKRPKFVRFDYVRAKAKMFLNSKGVNTPPVNSFDLLNEFGKIKWSNAIPEGITAYNEIKEKYYMIINPDHIKERINFTLAHEIGHIVLGHVIEYPDENFLTIGERKILEKEADIFASELLMPKEWVLDYLEEPITVPSLGRLKNSFGVSWQSITFRLVQLRICRKSVIENIFENWQKHYKIYINDQIASSKDIETETYEREIIMNNFVFPKVDNNMRFRTCPSCANEDFSDHASHCKKCGQYLYNDCTNNNFEFHQCQEKNVGDAVHCESCGIVTIIGELYYTFIKENAEDPFSDNEISEAVPADDPFANDGKPIDISDEDLPF